MKIINLSFIWIDLESINKKHRYLLLIYTEETKVNINVLKDIQHQRGFLKLNTLRADQLIVF